MSKESFNLLATCFSHLFLLTQNESGITSQFWMARFWQPGAQESHCASFRSHCSMLCFVRLDTQPEDLAKCIAMFNMFYR